MKFIYLALSFLLIGSFSAQFSNFNTQKNWSMSKKELIFGGGTTFFLGDLGGTENIGKDYSLADLDFVATSFNFTLGYRYRFHPVFSTTSSFNFGRYTASDYYTTNAGRNVRKIDVKSTLITFVQRLEYLVYVNEKVGKRNNIPGLKGMKDKNTQVYIYSGLGLSYYNPQAGPNTTSGGDFKLFTEGVELRPLATEGQGFGGEGKAYKLVTAVIPFGIGYRVGLGRMWRVAFEATYFKTFTDYMDDVSTTYFDYVGNGITPPHPETLDLANPAEAGSEGEWTLFKDGDKRGDKQKDAFLYFNVTFAKNLTYKSYVRKQLKWKGVRAKF
jgi:hypothetical protein